VIYIPGELGKFLDDFRRELVPGCNPHAHVSLLPPRPLAVDWRVASQQVRATLDGCHRFEIELTEIELFPVTDVVYLEVGLGAPELYRVHAAMNTGSLGFPDPFPYHPHVTLAQQLTADQVAAVSEQARRMWREYTGPRRFPADQAAFVQNSAGDCWINLAEFPLGGS
jgi:2'-5' RNA ligase